MNEIQALHNEVAALRTQLAELRLLVTALQATQVRNSWTSLLGSKPPLIRRDRHYPATMGIRVNFDPDDPYFNDSPDDWDDDE